SDNAVRSVAADSAGNVYVSGKDISTFSLNDIPVTSVVTAKTGDYPYLIKLEPNGPRPLALPSGVVSSADFSAPIAAGGLATVFGVGLTGVDGVVTATSFPLPAEIAGTSVTVN